MTVDRLRQAVIDVVEARGMFGVDAAEDLKWAMKHLSSALSTPPSDGRAEGLREAGDAAIAVFPHTIKAAYTWRPPIDPLQDYVTKEECLAYAARVRDAILAAASAPWFPPPEDQRPDGFRCFILPPDGEWSVGVWASQISRWWDVYRCHAVSPVAFAPLPAPVEGGKP